MSLHPQPIPLIPEETARIARTAFPHGNLYLMMRDELGTLFTDDDFAGLFPIRGQPAAAPWWLALVTIMPYSDGAATPHIHPALERQGLLPTTPIVDTGDLDAELLVTSPHEYSVDLRSPLCADGQWPAQAAQGLDASHFQIDGEQPRATCPGGYTSSSWTPAVDDRTHEVVKIKFSMKDCQPCAHRVHCTRAKRRTITVRRQEHHVALYAARVRETSAASTTEYADAPVLRERCPKGSGRMGDDTRGILGRRTRPSSMC
jgi:hypothetical protein